MCIGFNPSCETFLKFKFDVLVEMKTFIFFFESIRQAARKSEANTKPSRSLQWPRRAINAPRQAATGEQTALQTTKLVNPIKLVKVSDLGMHRTRPNGTYFKSNYGR
jgi:hypothetical protein